MNFEVILGISDENKKSEGFNGFIIKNLRFGSSYAGTLYDYNQIEFVSKSGGMEQWLQDYMQFEQHEAYFIATQLENWHTFITFNNKEP